MKLNKCGVLLVTPCLGIGGEELSTLSLAKELIKRGYRVIVRGNKGPLSSEFVNIGAKFFTSSTPYRRNVRGIISDTKDIKRLIEENEIKIIHSQSVLPTISAFLALKGNNKGENPRLIFHHRGIHQFTYPVVSRMLNHITDFVIVNSDYEKEKLIKQGLKRKHCRRIHNCINVKVPEETRDRYEVLKELGLEDNRKIIGTVGRLVRQKGYPFLLRAFKKVNEIYPKTRLLICGEGKEKKRLERDVHVLSLNEKVVFAGARRDLERIYPIMDIFVIPSLWEPLGNVTLEAAAFGKPVVATKVGGLPEAVLGGQTGLLVPPKNSGKLAEAILFLLRNPNVARKMGEAGRERVRSYFISERLGDEIEEVYENVLQGSSCG